MGNIGQSVDQITAPADELAPGAPGEVVSVQSAINGSNPPGAVNQTSSLVEVRPAGTLGKGLFAVQKIARGTRILSEAPFLVATPTSNSLKEHISVFCAALRDLPEDDIETNIRILDNLFGNENAVLDVRLRKQIPEIIHEWHMKNDHEKGCKTRKQVERADARAVDRFRIFRTNGISLGANPGQGIGLFALHSRINHSCRPNAVRTYRTTIGRNTIHANKDIQAGDQIFIDYNSSPWCRSEWQLKTHWRYGFTCQCKLCAGSEEPLQKNLIDFESEYCDCLAPKLEDAGCRIEARGYKIRNEEATKPEQVLHTIERALEVNESIAALLRHPAIDLLSHDLLFCYRKCARLCLELNDIPKAVKYAQEEFEVEQVIVGADVDHLSEGFEGAKLWLARLKQLVPTRDERCPLFLT